MKNFSRVLLAVVLVALSVVAAQAQSKMMLRGDVPFAFNVGDQQLPAGKYEVQLIGHELEGWYNAKGKGLFFMGTTPGKEGSLDTTKLVFHKYGDEYYLTEVWSCGQSHGVRISNKEQRLAKNNAPYEIVALVAEPGR